MNHHMKMWLVIAVVLIVVGGAVFVGAMAMVKWDFKQLSTTKYVINSYEISEKFYNISLIADTADVDFVLTDDGVCKVICYEGEKEKHTVSVAENTLKIQLVDERKWYEHIGIGYDSPKLTIYLPETQYGNVLVKTTTGDILMPKDFLLESLNITATTGDIRNSASATGAVQLSVTTGDIYAESMMAQSLDMKVSTGKIQASDIGCEGDVTLQVSTGDVVLKDIVCKKVVSGGSTGDIILENVIAAETFSLERSTGDVRFERSDAGEINVTTSTGDITGSLLSDKLYIVDNNTGEVILPKGTVGGKCEITTDTGDVILTIYKVEV